MKKFDEFINEGKLPKIKKGISEILAPFKENEVSIYRTFNMDKDQFSKKDNIENLYNDVDFNDKLKKKNLKKGKLQDTKYNEVLLENKYTLRFFFVYDKNKIEIEEPEYVMLQYYNKKNGKQSTIKCYKNDNNVQGFYKDLTDATIEIEKGKDNFIYQTSNSGNNWELKNIDNVQGKFKDELDNKEIRKVVKDKNVRVYK